MEQKQIRYLGWMNGWKQDGPERQIVEKCWNAKHIVETRSNGRCYEKVLCRTCSYEYEVDSSG